ncbi:MAG: DNA-directed RNA polymerase subunit omega [Actinobacteria bacterium]|nr:DNA-directed RNA polymerase subunit omega [Actinomycetota bacterium]
MIMFKNRPTLVEPPIEDLIDRIGSKFKLAVVAGKRARQISLYYSSLGQSIKGLVPPQVASLSDKALTMAFEEIAAGKLVSRPAAEIPQNEVAADDGISSEDASGMFYEISQSSDDGESDDGESDDGESDDGESDDGESDDGESDDGESDAPEGNEPVEA